MTIGSFSVLLKLVGGSLCLLLFASFPIPTPATAGIHRITVVWTIGDNIPGACANQVSPKDAVIPVDGANLESRWRAAINQGRSSAAGKSFWVAYQFPIRPGYRIDGSDCVFGRVSDSAGNTSEGRNGSEIHNAGVFLHYSHDRTAIQRAQIYSLDRKHDFAGQPVYWLGSIESDESLLFLRGLIDSKQSEAVARDCVTAIGLHDAPRAAQILKEYTAASYAEQIRSTAVFWVGRYPGMVPFLDGFARDEANGLELRKQAVFSIGSGDDDAAFPALESLYTSVHSSELKKQVVFAVSINRSTDAAVSFLIDSAHREPDREVRKTAIFWLGQKAGDRSLKALGDVVNDNDEDTEVKKQAVFALSQRPKDEAIPILIKIARTHPNGEVRKQAIFWLGQTGDERATAFFEEILRN